MNLRSEIINRLKEGGWTKSREGANHTIWAHPNGATYPLAHHPIRDNGDHRLRVLKSIEKKEKGGKTP